MHSEGVLEQGDYGGPLTVKDNITGAFTLVGLISYSVGCASGFPVINTRVAKYINFIYDVIGYPSGNVIG